MKVLHYIPNFKKSMGQAARFVQMLQVVMGKTVDMQIISGSISMVDFNRRIDTFRPDIIHIHGCWNFKAAIVELWAKHRKLPIVLSPHNSLSQKEIQADFWKKKLPCILLYQFVAIRKSMVLHATSSQELDDLKQLGWKKRIALIPEPKSQEENQQLTETFRTLYQKVIDTALRNILTEEEEKCLWILLRAAISARHEATSRYTPIGYETIYCNNVSDDMSTTPVTSLSTQEECAIQQLSVHNWKSIQVYAIDHGIIETVLAGSISISLMLPVTVNTLPSRFRRKSAIRNGSLSKKERELLNKGTSDKNTVILATNMLCLYKILCSNQYSTDWQPPFRILLSIYEHLLHKEYDEDSLCKIVSRLKIKTFSARIMQILAERLQLPIGFMPCEPLQGKSTKALYQKLNDFNISKETT